MTIIQCKLGPIETVVGSDTYIFRLDENGRAVAEVPNISHQLCFLSVEHYVVAPVIEAAPEEIPVEVTIEEHQPAPEPVDPEQSPAPSMQPGLALNRRGKRRQG